MHTYLTLKRYKNAKNSQISDNFFLKNMRIGQKCRNCTFCYEYKLLYKDAEDGRRQGLQRETEG